MFRLVLVLIFLMKIMNFCFNRSNSTFYHNHFSTFTIHPGITTLIACSIIAVLLLIYMWSKSLWKIYVFLRQTCCCCCSYENDSGKRHAKDEIEMINQGSQYLSADKVLFSSSDEESDIDAAIECQSHDNVSFQAEKEQGATLPLKNILQQKAFPILLTSLTNIKTFPESPMILLTPATPTPNHASFEKIDSLCSDPSSFHNAPGRRLSNDSQQSIGMF